MCLAQCVKVAGDYVEWEDGGNRSVQITEGPCSVAFNWGDEGSLKVEPANGKPSSENGASADAHAQEQPPKVSQK